jgi:hypothetical protein
MFRALYIILGTIVMAGLLFTIVAFVYHVVKDDELFTGAVFWGETVCLMAYGIAWLRRGIHVDT